MLFYVYYVVTIYDLVCGVLLFVYLLVIIDRLCSICVVCGYCVCILYILCMYVFGDGVM